MPLISVVQSRKANIINILGGSCVATHPHNFWGTTVPDSPIANDHFSMKRRRPQQLPTDRCRSARRTKGT